MLGVGIGVAAVILLTSIGAGTRRHLVSEFTQFGTNILQVTPGKTETVGIPGVLGGTTRQLTIEDALSLERIHGVEHVLPVALGQARVEAGGLGRSVYVYGVTAEMPEVWRFAVASGTFLPGGDPRRGAQVAVLGPKLKRELFGERNPLGEWVRVADTRLRVIGVMESKGELLGFDLDDTVFLPVATAMRLFNLEELIEIDVTFAHRSGGPAVVERIREVLTERHAGNEDFTVLTQERMLAVFGRIMDVVTLAVGGIAGISLLVGAVGILTVMWISVGERTTEIGLLRALGATRGEVQRIFLLEATGLAVCGGLGGLAAGFGTALLARAFVPGLPLHTPVSFAALALAVCAGVGLLSGLSPARRAARLDPIEALRAE
jgi:putative ABC transport system permease protein